MEHPIVEQWNILSWNIRTSGGGNEEHLTLEQWNRDDGKTVEHLMEEQWHNHGGTVEHLMVEQ